MTNYGLAVDLAALQQLLRMDEEQRSQVIELLERLRLQPFLQGDYREVDDTGRVNEVVLAGNALVFFWSDHAVKTVRVAKVDFIDGD